MRLFLVQVTFRELVKDVVSTWSSGKEMNIHWRPQHLICHPCYFKYDFVGRFENVEDDAKRVLAKIAAGSNVTYPHLRSTHKKHSFVTRTT